MSSFKHLVFVERKHRHCFKAVGATISSIPPPSDPMDNSVAEPFTQMYKGQLRIKMLYAFGTLTITVQQARHLSSRYGLPLTTYVKLALITDTKNWNLSFKTPPTSERTSSPKDARSLSPNSRIVISIWNSNTVTSNWHELVGCMCFGLANAKNQLNYSDGWYFLLSDCIGNRKHLRVDQRHGSTPETDSQQTGLGSRLRQPMCFQDKHKINIKNKGKSFGFKIYDAPDEFKGEICRTCRVKEIHKDSNVYKSGLRNGDIIMSVNGIKVRSLFVDSIANIIKNSGNELQLEVCRQIAIRTLTKSPMSRRRCSVLRVATEAKVMTTDRVKRKKIMTIIDSPTQFSKMIELANRIPNSIFQTCVNRMKVTMTRI